MATDDSTLPKSEPVETGVVIAQQPAPVPDGDRLTEEAAKGGPALQPSPMASAIQEAGAFKYRAAEVFAAKWAEDVHGRLRRTEEELRDTREELDAQRDKATRLEERLDGLGREHGAQDRLKVLGGALIGIGGPLVLEAAPGKIAVGVVCILAGWVLAFGVPWGRHSG